jgi:flagella basal body P-ring formation protein FlgA
MSKTFIFLPILYLSAFISYNSQSATFDSSYIKDFAKKHVESQITAEADTKVEVSVSNIDNRIKIKPCDLPLKANIPQNNTRRNVNVKISCNDPTPWQMFLQVKIRTTVPILVATMTISKGSFLDDSNIDIRYLEQNKIRGERITDIDTVYGGKAKRRIAKGSNITRRNICLVCKGDSVTIVAKSATLMIKTAGIALSDGRIGDQIRVKNKQSGRTITAQIKTINKVVINL